MPFAWTVIDPLSWNKTHICPFDSFNLSFFFFTINHLCSVLLSWDIIYAKFTVITKKTIMSIYSNHDISITCAPIVKDYTSFVMRLKAILYSLYIAYFQGHIKPNYVLNVHIHYLIHCIFDRYAPIITESIRTHLWNLKASL